MTSVLWVSLFSQVHWYVWATVTENVTKVSHFYHNNNNRGMVEQTINDQNIKTTQQYKQ